MQRKFVTNLILLLFLNFLIKPFWIFGIDRTVQNTVSNTDYGVYFALLNFSMLFNIIIDFGITSFNTRNIAQHNQLLTKYFSGIVLFKIVLSIIYLLVTFVVGYFSGYSSERFYILSFLAVNQILISFIQYFRSNIAGLQLFKIDSILSVVDKLIMIVLCSILLWTNITSLKLNIYTFVYAQTIAYVATAILVFLVVLSKVSTFRIKINKAFSFHILKQTFPYALLVLTMSFYYRLDAIMIDWMLPEGESQVGIYAKAYRIMDAANQIGVLFAGLLLPIFAYSIKKKDLLSPLIKVAFSLLFIPAFILAIFTFFNASSIIELLYYGVEAQTSKVLVILMFCFLAIAITYIFGTLLTANNNIKQLNFIAIIGLVVNVVLNFILIPKYQAYGSAIASLITQVVVVLMQIYVSIIVFKLSVGNRFIIRLGLYVLILLLTAYMLNYFTDKLLINAIFVVLVGVLLGISLKIISIKKILNIVLNKSSHNVQKNS